MTDVAVELARLKKLCSGAELWSEGGHLVFLPGLTVESGGSKQKVDALLSPGARDGYDNRLYFSARLPVPRNWNAYAMKARTWHAFSWRGIQSGQPWLTILLEHLEAAK